MFTGIVQALGKVQTLDDLQLTLSLPFPKLELGESIAINGVCLTVASETKNCATFDIGPETRRVTTLAFLHAGDVVNLERALRVGDRLGGHWVTGHVEGTALIREIKQDPASWWLTLEIPKALDPFVIDKGSLAVDGVSLTVVDLKKRLARFMILPYTWTHTNLRDRSVGQQVNIETDLLARYILKARPAG